jgi:hypothetical protein
MDSGYGVPTSTLAYFNTSILDVTVLHVYLDHITARADQALGRGVDDRPLHEVHPWAVMIFTLCICLRNEQHPKAACVHNA